MLKKIKLLIITVITILQVLIFISCQMEEDRPSKDHEQPTQQLTQELNQWLYPLTQPPLLLADNDLSFLNQLGNAKLVALGEATHGTKEFFQMKHRIFQYLVEYFQHKAFGFEADFAESLYFDKYICQGQGDLEELMKTKMHFWTWRTREVKQLLEWMKDYNTTRSEDEKIHYYGFDCQFTTYQPDWIQQYLEPAFPDLWETAAPILDQVRDLSDDDYKNMSQETYNDIKTQLESLENQLIAYKDQISAYYSPEEYEIIKQLLNTFKQAFIFRYHYAISDYSINLRDKFMAENALWIADFLDQNAKITLWAHNGHIAKNPDLGEDGAMGYNLSRELNNQYQTVAFSFSLGSFTAVGIDQNRNYTQPQTHEITTEPLNDSINFIFHNASQPNFAFYLDAIPDGSQWDKWLNSPRASLSLGAVYFGSPSRYYVLIDFRRDHNWIIYFDRTTASELIPRD